MFNKIFKCEHCGNIVELLHEGNGVLICCNSKMGLLEENQSDGAVEKHVPVLENNRVRVGSTEHPMDEEHYIEWIEATDGREISRVFFKAGKKPLAEFSFEPISARAYCNLHGLWKSKD